MPTTPADLLAARILHERRWAYERRLERMPYYRMRELSARPVHEGGLGYELSEPTLCRRANDFLKLQASDDIETRDDKRAVELANMDLRERAWARQTERIDREATQQYAIHVGELGRTVSWLVEHRPDLIILRDEKIVQGALRGIELVAIERRKLLGLDAPAEVTVTHKDQRDDELSELMEEAARARISPVPRNG